GQSPNGHAGVVVAPDGKAVFTQHGNQIRCWDIATGNELKKFSKQPGKKNASVYAGVGSGALALSPDGKTLVAAVYGQENGKKGPYTNTIRIWKAESGEEIRTISPPQTYGNGTVAVAPDGKTLAFTAPNAIIYLYNLQTGQELRQIPQPRQVVSYGA